MLKPFGGFKGEIIVKNESLSCIIYINNKVLVTGDLILSM